MAPRTSEEVSDDESAGEAIPFKSVNRASSDDDDDNSEDEGDVYVVESIVGHEFQKNGKLMLNVKWKGYDDPADQTLEPEDSLLEGAGEAVQEYYKKIGGRPQQPGGAKPGRGKRKSMTSAKATPDKPSTKKQKLSSKDETNGTDLSDADIGQGIPDWVHDKEHWGRDVVKVQTIENDETHGLVAYLNWTNGKTTKVSINLCYESIPMLMLKFYEAHLVFKDGQEEGAGEGAEE
ncbi:hypothetical protein UA08_08533 [Talaromyces atroroseus]|uniref:Chromo domain-containing protein n=1 Tax=Talaromyces atroroseus TaxID=1441469 RepID=A0A1Q5Q8A4_TALAT|nr:hypothetical protein UA08_08533 [Talaromyces atroroseus]OKL56351.1 hypothetical protein UA08_08533 [Talaromyces atroroseus]